MTLVYVWKKKIILFENVFILCHIFIGGTQYNRISCQKCAKISRVEI